MTHYQSPPQLPIPSRSECHLWTLRMEPLQGHRTALAAPLTAEEHQREAAFLRAADRDRFMLGRGALRVLLSAYTDIAAADVVIRLDGRGKPYLPDKGLIFSVAHSGSLLMLAFSAADALGVDVEQVRPLKGWPDVTGRVLHPSEQADLTHLPTEMQVDRFFRYWTLKEALAKAAGLGLALPFDAVHIAIDGDSARLLEVPAMLGRVSRWWTLPVDVGSGYRAGLAGCGSGLRIRHYDDRTLIGLLNG